jgi:hypothetical protein
MTEFVDFNNNEKADPDGVNRQRWKFDENGFDLATQSALLLAQQEMRDKIRSLHDDVVNVSHPNDYQVSVDGTPIDKVKFEG